MQGDRKQPFGLRIGFDVDRKHPQRGPEMGRLQIRIDENPVDAARRACPPGSCATERGGDRQRAAQSALHEVAHGKTDIRLVTTDAGRRQFVAQRRRVGRQRQLHPAQRLVFHAAPGFLVGRRQPRPEVRRGVGLGRFHVEGRAFAAIAHHKGLAGFEHAIKLDDRHSAVDRVGRLQDEAAHGFGGFWGLGHPAPRVRRARSSAVQSSSRSPGLSRRSRWMRVSSHSPHAARSSPVASWSK